MCVGGGWVVRGNKMHLIDSATEKEGQKVIHTVNTKQPCKDMAIKLRLQQSHCETNEYKTEKKTSLHHSFQEDLCDKG